MKKIVSAIITCLSFASLFAQQDTVLRTPPKKVDLSNRPGDHFMIQLSSDHWAGASDTIKSHKGALSRGFNFYIMIDRPLKGDSRYSIGIGIGIGSSNMVFKKLSVDVKSASSTIPFTPLDSSSHFKRYKLSMSYLEVPLELRFTSNPGNNGSSWKFALGAKVGTLVNLHTKGKDFEDKNSNLINSYTEKENSTRYFTGTRLMGTVRIGYGIFSLFGSYQINSILKAGFGPDMKLWQAGITFSGL